MAMLGKKRTAMTSPAHVLTCIELLNKRPNNSPRNTIKIAPRKVTRIHSGTAWICPRLAIKMIRPTTIPSPKIR